MSDLRIPDLNHVMIAGRLTRDVELKYTAGGGGYCKLSIASTRRYKRGDEQKEETLFIDAMAWGKIAEYVAAKMGKGRPVLVEGSLKLNEWTGRDGEKKQKIEINATRVQALDWDDRGEKKEAKPEPAREREPGEEDDLPF